MTENELATIVIGEAIAVHSFLGPGLLESAYEECLSYKLVGQGLQIQRQKPVPIIMKVSLI